MQKQTYLLCALALLFITFAQCAKKLKPAAFPEKGSTATIEEFHADYLQSKGSVYINDNKTERQFKINLLMRDDSVIWINASFVGISGARALINKDSITIVNHIEKGYYVLLFDQLSEKFNFPISYALIQRILLGNLLYPREAEYIVRDDSVHQELVQTVKNISIRYIISDLTKKILSVRLSENNTDSSIEINNSKFVRLDDKTLPTFIRLNIQYKNKKNRPEKLVLILNFNKVELGKCELKFPFSIPRRYERKN